MKGQRNGKKRKSNEEDELGELTEPERYEEPRAKPDKKYEVALEDDELVIKTKDVASRDETADEVKTERATSPRHGDRCLPGPTGSGKPPRPSNRRMAPGGTAP